MLSGNGGDKHVLSEAIVISGGLPYFRAVASEDRHHFNAITVGDLEKPKYPAFN